MIGKVFVWGFRIGTVGALVGVSIIGVSIYLGLQRPAFYEKVLSEPISDIDREQANLEMDSLTQRIKSWLDQSQQRQLQTIVHKVDQNSAAGEVYDPDDDTLTFRLTERQLNVLLSSEKFSFDDSIADPRVELSSDEIRLAFKLEMNDVRCYPVVRLQPKAITDKRVQIGILGAGVGKLPFPIQTIFSLFGDELNRVDRNIEFEFNSDRPKMTLKMRDKDAPRIKSLLCRDGEIWIELLPPNGRLR